MNREQRVVVGVALIWEEPKNKDARHQEEQEQGFWIADSDHFRDLGGLPKESFCEREFLVRERLGV